MNLRYLQYFQALAKYEHYTKAAEELGIAQSSLSHAISCLEEELQAPLFEKRGRNVVLTPAGNQYLQCVDTALQLLEKGRQLLKSFSSGAIRVGFVSSVRTFLIDKITAFRAKYPPYRNCQFSIYESATGSLVEALTKEHLDVILASAPGGISGLDPISLFQQELVVIDSAQSPHLQGDRVDVPTLAKVPIVLHTTNSGMRKIVDSIFSSYGLPPISAGEVSSDRTMAQVVAIGVGAAITTNTEEIRQPGVRILTLDHPNSTRSIYLTTKKGRYTTPAQQAFTAFLQET